MRTFAILCAAALLTGTLAAATESPVAAIETIGKCTAAKNVSYLADGLSFDGAQSFIQFKTAKKLTDFTAFCRVRVNALPKQYGTFV
ncbi:MAG: hypothetical protein PHS41_11045, partial [Victivallaceae bacterium]|nr:hypothetical protein [Victivallaceae bacterium]